MSEIHVRRFFGVNPVEFQVIFLISGLTKLNIDRLSSGSKSGIEVKLTLGFHSK